MLPTVAETVAETRGAALAVALRCLSPALGCNPGKEIRKLNFGRADTPVLKLLRRVLRESRAVAKAESAGNPPLGGSPARVGPVSIQKQA